MKNQQPFNNEAALSKPWNISSSLSMFVCLLILNFITLRCLQHQHLTVNRWKISWIETPPSVTVEGIPPTKIFFVRKSFEFQPATPLGIVRLISTYKQNYSMHQLSFPFRYVPSFKSLTINTKKDSKFKHVSIITCLPLIMWVPSTIVSTKVLDELRYTKLF